VHGKFGRRRPEDQPAATRVDVGQAEYIAKNARACSASSAKMTVCAAMIMLAASLRPDDLTFASAEPKTGEVFQYLRMCT